MQSLEKTQVANAGKFFFLLVVSFVALNLLVSLVPILAIEKFIAGLAGWILERIGISLSLGADAHAFIQIVQGPRIIINELCTGVLETIVLVSAILATFEIDARKRILGALAGVVAVFVFNLFRIVSTILIVLSQPIEVAVLSHDVLFRVFLFVVIAGFYWTWIRWSSQTPSNKVHKTGFAKRVKKNKK